ncbi:MAG: GNAT family N-acetyltransferase [Chloroflexi bacterium]|nr:GNAT family N-acetyltransferase [Chloroflexota bacterium]
MDIQVRKTEFEEIAPLRALYRHEAHCQIIRDSILGRGLADPYLILVDARVAGCAGVWNEHFKDRVMEFHALPQRRADILPMFRELLAVSGATHVEAQTNMPLMNNLLYDFATNISVENILFEDGPVTNLSCPGTVFRPRDADEGGPEGDWVVNVNEKLVAAGGVMDHYNPPYGDIYMKVIPGARRQGIGSYLVQELRRVCYEKGRKPAARCDPDNDASRRTLQRGGLLPSGRLLAGEVRT